MERQEQDTLQKLIECQMSALHKHVATATQEISETSETVCDEVDRAAELQVLETITGSLHHATMQLDNLEEQLDRIEKGTIGICVECAAKIPLQRLHVMPHACTCVICQGQLESKAPTIVRPQSLDDYARYA